MKSPNRKTNRGGIGGGRGNSITATAYGELIVNLTLTHMSGLALVRRHVS